MRTVKKTFDTNALIENISYKIDVRAGVPCATITFDNLGYGDVTAVKFTASGYNSFGDVISVNGSPAFTIIIQDIRVPANKKGFSTTVSLPHNDIRTLGIVQNQVCLSDGRVLTYEGKKPLEVVFQEYTLDTAEEKEEISVLREKFGKEYTYVPVETEDGWLCACGRLNGKENASCTNCQNSKAELFEYTDKEKINALIEEKRIREEKQKVINGAKKQRKKTRVDFLIVIALVLLVFSQAVYILLGLGFSYNYDDFGIKFFYGAMYVEPILYYLTKFFDFFVDILPTVALILCAWVYHTKPKAGKIFLAATFVLWGGGLVRWMISITTGILSTNAWLGLLQVAHVTGLRGSDAASMIFREYWNGIYLGSVLTALALSLAVIVLHIPSVVLSLTGTKKRTPFVIVASLTALPHFIPLVRAIRNLFERFPYHEVIDYYSYVVGVSEFFIYLQWWLYKGINFLSVLLPIVIFSILLITICVRFAPKPKERLAPRA